MSSYSLENEDGEAVIDWWDEYIDAMEDIHSDES
jgi:hypothetical protein